MLFYAAGWLAEVDAARRAGVYSWCCFGGVAGILGLLALGFWIWCIIEVATKEPATEPNKIMWVLLVLLLNPLGGIIYLLVRRPERIRRYGR